VKGVTKVRVAYGVWVTYGGMWGEGGFYEDNLFQY